MSYQFRSLVVEASVLAGRPLSQQGGHMKLPNWRRVLAPAAILLAAGLACGTALAQGSDAEEMHNSANPHLWPSMGQNLALDRHSELTQINPSNVKHLEMIWSQSTGALRGHEGQPIVVDVGGKPMMFFVSAWPNIVQALDLSDPDHPVEVWNYLKKTDRDLSAVPRACCDTVNRGLNYADGKVRLQHARWIPHRARCHDRESGLGSQARLSRSGRDRRPTRRSSPTTR